LRDFFGRAFESIEIALLNLASPHFIITCDESVGTTRLNAQAIGCFAATIRNVVTARIDGSAAIKNFCPWLNRC
jgi:hypothetical protein